MKKLIAAFICLSTISARGAYIDSDAQGCRFYIDGLALLESSYLGWSNKVLHVEYIIRDSDIDGAGYWIQYLEKGISNETIVPADTVLQPDIQGKKATVEFLLAETPMRLYGSPVPENTERQPLSIAFFVEKKQSNERFWLSNHGSNYSFTDILRPALYAYSQGRTTFAWASQEAQIFNPKRACN